MELEIKTFLVVLVGASNFMLGILLLGKNTHDRLNQGFALLTTGILFWAFSGAAFHLIADLDQARIAMYFLYSAATLLPSSYLLIALCFPPTLRPGPVALFGIILANTAVVAAIFVPGFVLDYIAYENGTKIIHFGTGYIFYVLYFLVIFSIGLWILFSKYLRAVSPLKIQIRDLLMGTTIPMIMGLAGNLILPWLGYYQLYTWFGQLMTFVFALSIFYAIARHHLLNIKILTTEVFVTVIILTLVIQFLFSRRWEDFLLNGGMLAVITFFSWFLVRAAVKEAEDREQIAELASKLQQSNDELKKLDQAKSEFISIASHQLRAPLTVIRGYISLFLEGSFGKIAEAGQGALEKVAFSSGQLVKLVNDLLNLSRIESGKIRYEFKQANFSDLASAIVEEFHPMAHSKGKEISFQNDAPGVVLNFDPDKMRETVVNLLDNAIKYSKSAILVKLEQVVKGGQKYLRFSVKDDGIGLKSEDIARLFTKFTRSIEAQRMDPNGMGIGLYFVKRVIEDHGGRTWVESAGAEKGSTFFVELPIQL